MPELAEVYYHASIWKASLGERFRLGWVHESARCCRALDFGLARTALAQASLLAGHTHGKRMLFEFSGGVYLEVHLGMTGSLLREAPGYQAGRHDHFGLEGERSVLVFRDPRMFGKLALHRSAEGLPQWWQALPPQPQERAFTVKRFAGYCQRRQKRPLKAFLLDQALFPGVGNWMADEILWRTRLRPARRVGSLEESERNALYQELRWVCREALRIIGSDYSDPPRSWLFSHRWKDGGVCPATGKPLRREAVGGRSTCWSPAWQR